MASTVTLANIKRVAVGDRFQVRAKVTESGTYATPGTPITALSLGLRYIEHAIVEGPNAVGIAVTWDQAPGTSATFKTDDEDNISGVSAEFSGTAVAVYHILVTGF